MPRLVRRGKAQEISRKRVVIYRDRMFRKSETFIPAQGRALQRWSPYYVGLERLDYLPVPVGDTFAVNDGTVGGFVRESAFKLVHRSIALETALRAAQPQLVHAHFGVDALRILPTVRRLQLPLVVTMHGYDATMTDQTARRCTYGMWEYVRRRSEVFAYASVVLAVSEFIKGRLVQLGVPSHKVRVHYTGVDTQRFRPSPHATRTSRQVLFVGRLVPEKGCAALLDAMARVQKVIPDASLTIIGYGRLRDSLEQRAAQLGVHAQFLGYQPPEVVQAALQTCAVFCGPSQTGPNGITEGFGMVFAEAQASGVPVVSFACGGVSEAVAHGRTGLLAPEGDVGALADMLTTLLCDERRAESMGSQGRAWVLERYDLAKQAAKLEAMYEEVAQS